MALQTIIFALAAGVFCQLVSEKVKIPSIFFLLIVGVLLGPTYVGVVQPSAIQGALSIIIEIGVAIILFEGGLSLRINQVQAVSRPIQKLLTLGALITFVCVLFSCRWIIGLSWNYSFMIGALMVVTGPTVIGPIIKRLPLRRDLSTILNWESILLDPIGVIMVVLIADFIMAEDASVFLTFVQFFKILLVGSAVGAAFGFILYLFLRWVGEMSRETINLFVLAGALMSFEVAEMVTDNSGLLAVVCSGVFLANAPFPRQHRKTILEFKGTLASLWISFIFVLLAARLNVSEVFGWGAAGWVFLGVLIFLIRPLNVFVSTYKSSFTFREKLFLSWIAPRGIIAASAASFFAIAFAAKGFVNASAVENLSYLVIATTVTLQGLSAGVVARFLGVLEVKNTGTLIVGAHALSRNVAKTLKKYDIDARLVDTDYFNVELAIQEGLDAFCGDALDQPFLEELQIRQMGVFVALTPNNKVNILACQLAQKILPAKVVYQLLPHQAKSGVALAQKIGGTTVLPEFPYLDVVNTGLEEGSFEWTERTIPKGTVYKGAVSLPDGDFWPLLLVDKKNAVSWITIEHHFQTDTLVFGVRHVRT